jgi:hypothetical protein
MPMLFIQNPLRLRDEFGYSGIGPDKPEPRLGDPMTPEEAAKYPKAPPARQKLYKQLHRRRRKSKRIH